jgi:hypothetical protein
MATGLGLNSMKWIRSPKFFGAHVGWAVLLPLLVFSWAFSCPEDTGQNTGSLILGSDICDDDSSCLLGNAGDLIFRPVGFSHLPTSGSTIPQIFVHSIYHPPRA